VEDEYMRLPQSQQGKVRLLDEIETIANELDLFHDTGSKIVGPFGEIPVIIKSG